jgi:hypothetical protein
LRERHQSPPLQFLPCVSIPSERLDGLCGVGRP